MNMAYIVNQNTLNVKNPATGEFETIPMFCGESAYQTATKNGFEGTEKEWLASLSSKVINDLETDDNTAALSATQGKVLKTLIDEHNHDDVYYTESEVDDLLSNKLDTSLKGSASGLAELDESGKVLSSQLPSYVDDIIEGYYVEDKFYSDEELTIEIVGEGGKIYTNLLNTNNDDSLYRWSGSKFVPVISGSLTLGETSSTAFRGDLGVIAFNHALSEHAPVDLSDVATTGSYNDLTDKPEEMTGASDTTDGMSGFVPAPVAGSQNNYLRGDGTWVDITPASLGNGYAVCDTEETDASKLINIDGFKVTIGGILSVRFINPVTTAGTKLLINDVAYPVYYRGEEITEGVIGEDDTATFMFDGTNYNMIAIDKVGGGDSVNVTYDEENECIVFESSGSTSKFTVEDETLIIK